MADPKVKPERTEWRDLRISKRHRQWGFDAPSVDLDFLPLVEYNHRIPVAIVEYKHEFAPPQWGADASLQALKYLADSAKIPFIICIYADDFSWFRVTAFNEKARSWIPGKYQKMSEPQWVNFIYELRGSKPSPEVMKQFGEPI